jgi:hypothetical protein
LAHLSKAVRCPDPSPVLRSGPSRTGPNHPVWVPEIDVNHCNSVAVAANTLNCWFVKKAEAGGDVALSNFSW